MKNPLINKSVGGVITEKNSKGFSSRKILTMHETAANVPLS
jgi:hypothetical protein